MTGLTGIRIKIGSLSPLLAVLQCTDMLKFASCDFTLTVLWAFRHEGPVWQVAWAHPMFGNLLASCSYDRKVIIWKETNGTWGKLYEYGNHDSSGIVNVAQ